MKKVCSALLAVILVALPLFGCGANESEEAPQQQDLPKVSIAADPEGAIEEIYRDIDIKEVAVADDDLMEDTLGFDLWNDIEEYYVRYSSGRYGIADVYIIKPYESSYDVVRENLEAIKLDRVRKSESYDILDSHKIAQEAEIYRYGSYLIMLMLEDNEAAMEIISRYIPSTET